ncbi:MAG: RNA polymerase sigma factor [Chloroflexota bacterium]|nr:RNA polymerase sigma factor [Chloroflexota bacterium]
MVSDLVQRAQRGDHEAFASLVRPHLDRLHGLAGLLLRDPARAEDALQEALLSAWRDLPKLRDAERFEAWLRRLVVNASYDEGRRLKRRRGEVSFAPQHEPRTGGGHDHLLDRDELIRGFRRLNDEERSVIALRYYLDLSNAEAAEALGIREVTYRSKLHRALRIMQAALAAESRSSTQSEGGLS